MLSERTIINVDIIMLHSSDVFNVIAVPAGRIRSTQAD